MRRTISAAAFERLDAEPPEVIEHLGLEIKTQPKAEWEAGFFCSQSVMSRPEQRKAAAKWEEALK